MSTKKFNPDPILINPDQISQVLDVYKYHINTLEENVEIKDSEERVSPLDYAMHCGAAAVLEWLLLEVLNIDSQIIKGINPRAVISDR